MSLFDRARLLTFLVSSFQAIQTSLSQLPWRGSGAAPRGCDHYFRPRPRLGPIIRRRKQGARLPEDAQTQNLTEGTELGNSDASVGRSSRLVRRTGGGLGGTLRSPLSSAERNTARDCFTLKWTNLWRGKLSGPPRDLGVMSLYEVPSSLSLATTLFAIECKCTCGCYELLHCFDVCGPRSVGIMNLCQQVLNY